MFSRQTAGRVILAATVLAGGVTSMPAHGQGPLFLAGQPVGTVESALLREASGLAASRANADVLWAHNDSGDTARLFAMNLQGTHLGVYNLLGVTATDCEDLAIGPGPVAGQAYLYLGDIGDNNAVHTVIRLYRVPEPAVSATQTPVTVSLSGVATITLQYSDGPRDAETLMADPVTGDVYIVSKRETPSRVYRAAYPQSTTETVTLEYCGQLTWGWATGGDISPNGGEILVRGYTSAYMWRRPAGTTVWAALSGTGYQVPLVSEPQGEASCFERAGHGYFTLSEGYYQPVYYFERVPGAGALDSDGDVDAGDFEILAGCLAGPNVDATAECTAADLTADGDVDLDDLGEFARRVTGP